MSDYNYVIKIAATTAAASTDVVRLEEVDVFEVTPLEGEGVPYLNGTRGFLVNSYPAVGGGNITEVRIDAPFWTITTTQTAELFGDLLLNHKQVYVFDVDTTVRRVYRGYITSLPLDWYTGVKRDPNQDAVVIVDVNYRGTYAAWDGAKNVITWVDTTTTNWAVADIEIDNAGELGFTS